MTDHVSSTSYIQDELESRLVNIGNHLNGDVITVVGPINDGLDTLIRFHVEAIDPRKTKLTVILETQGGYIEVTERVVKVLRYFYPEVDFIVPSHAMSAGTILVMSGDAIYMDYYSVLGPIDPQIPSQGGRPVPALGYLAKYNELIAKSGMGSGLSAAEIAYLIERFDPGELHSFEQAAKLSTDLLKTWLATYKFKDWKTTQARGIAVDDAMRKSRAEEIATFLNDIDRWKSHGRGIHMDVLINDAKLMIVDFGADKALNDLMKAYYRLLKDHMGQQNHSVVMHTCSGYIGA